MSKLAPITSRDHSFGKTNAPWNLVEYGDYQCPSCGDAHPIVKQLQQHFGDDLLFEHQASLKDTSLLKLAVSLRLSSDHLKHALTDGTYAARVKSDLDSGIAANVEGTPTFYINGHLYEGAYDFDSLVEAIKHHTKLKSGM